MSGVSSEHQCEMPRTPRLEPQTSPPVIDGRLRKDEKDSAGQASEPQSSSDTTFNISLVEHRPICLPILADPLPAVNWLFSLDGNPIDPTSEAKEELINNGGNPHGCVHGSFIKRTRIRQNFSAYAATANPMTKKMAQHLFDRYGCLRDVYKNHPIKKGSGVWGNEMDRGNIVFIEHLLADAHVHNRGKGHAVFREVMENACKLGENVIILTCMKVGEPETLEGGFKMDEVMKEGVEFIRSLDFRRVGNTPYFAYSMDPNHASHKISAAEDYNPPAVDHVAFGLYHLAYHIIPWASDDSCVDFFVDCLQKLDPNDVNWTSTNERGRTVLHEAAVKLKPVVVKYILKYARQLTAFRDGEGSTPLEALTSYLDMKRTFFPDPESNRAYPDDFLGYKADEIACLQALDPADKTYDQLRFGCTCCRCVNGYLSPRMARRLQIYATALQSKIQGDANYLTTHYSPLGGNFFHLSNPQLSMLPQHTKVMLIESLTLRQALVNMFSFVNQCFLDGVLPVDINIMTASIRAGPLGDGTKDFFEHGGSCQFIRSMIFDAAATNSEWAGFATNEEEITMCLMDLPKCRNDLEFILCERKCNLDSGILVGQLPSKLA